MEQNVHSHQVRLPMNSTMKLPNQESLDGIEARCAKHCQAKSSILCLFKAIAPTPRAASRLLFKKCTGGTKVSFMSQEVGLFLPFGPELDGIGQCIHGLPMASDKRSSEIDMLQVMLFGL